MGDEHELTHRDEWAIQCMQRQLLVLEDEAARAADPRAWLALGPPPPTHPPPPRPLAAKDPLLPGPPPRNPPPRRRPGRLRGPGPPGGGRCRSRHPRCG